MIYVVYKVEYETGAIDLRGYYVSEDEIMAGGLWKAAAVGVILCLAATAGWKALLRASPIDAQHVHLPPPPPALGVYAHNTRLKHAIKLADGLLPGAEDLAIDSHGRLYTGCADGWIKRISFAPNPKVENWTYVGGHPLGVALGLRGELIVCEPRQGLLNVTEGKVEPLSNGANGLKFKLADGVAVSKEGLIYFTDASYKYGLEEHLFDILEYRPRGRLLSYNPATAATTVLLQNLYFPNGVALSANEDFLVFAETPMARIQRYWLQGEKRGSVEPFIENLPGFPDNIRNDGEGNFWVAFPTARTRWWDAVGRYPSARNIVAALVRLFPGSFAWIVDMKESGVLAVGEDGKPVALYSDPNLVYITSGLKVGAHLYFVSLKAAFVGRLALAKETSTS